MTLMVRNIPGIILLQILPLFKWLSLMVTLDDGWTNAIPIGFPFDFYGNQYTNLYLSTNGFLSFNALTSSYITNAHNSCNRFT